MPHRTVHCRKDGIANRYGAMYAAWVEGKIPHHRLAADGIAHDILFITSKTPFPLDNMAILAAMSRQESGLMLMTKLFLFGHMCGVHRQRMEDRASEQSKRQPIAQNAVHGACAAGTVLSLGTWIESLRVLADRLNDRYHEAEAYERRVYREGHTGTDGSWHGDDSALAVARERMSLLRSVLGDLEPILYRMEDAQNAHD